VDGPFALVDMVPPSDLCQSPIVAKIPRGGLRGERQREPNTSLAAVMLLWVIAGSCVLTLFVSFVFTKAASKSPLWNMGFAVALVLTIASLLTVGLVLVLRKLFQISSTGGCSTKRAPLRGWHAASRYFCAPRHRMRQTMPNARRT
jgi:hypothetical protein